MNTDNQDEKNFSIDDALLQDRLDAAMAALKLSLEDHYEPYTLGMVMKLIEDIWRLLLEQERRNSGGMKEDNHPGNII